MTQTERNAYENWEKKTNNEKYTNEKLNDDTIDRCMNALSKNVENLQSITEK